MTQTGFEFLSDTSAPTFQVLGLQIAWFHMVLGIKRGVCAYQANTLLTETHHKLRKE